MKAENSRIILVYVFCSLSLDLDVYSLSTPVGFFHSLILLMCGWPTCLCGFLRPFFCTSIWERKLGLEERGGLV